MWLVGLVRIGDLCHWPSVLRSICYVGERLAYRDLPNNSFLFPYCMVSIIPGFPLQCRIRVYCLVCVMHMLKSGYWFLCIVCVLCVLLLLNCLIVLHMNCCKCYTWVHIYPAGICAGLNYFIRSCWCIVFVARRTIFKLVCLKRLVILGIGGMWYENVTHFLFVVVGSFFSDSFFFRLWMICNGNPLFWAIASVIFYSCCLACFVIASVNILFM